MSGRRLVHGATVSLCDRPLAATFICLKHHKTLVRLRPFLRGRVGLTRFLGWGVGGGGVGVGVGWGWGWGRAGVGWGGGGGVGGGVGAHRSTYLLCFTIWCRILILAADDIPAFNVALVSWHTFTIRVPFATFLRRWLPWCFHAF